MENSFEDLIKEFGVPKIIIPNTPNLVMLGTSSILVSDQPERETQPDDKIFYRRFKYGNSEFLAVSSRIKKDLSEEEMLLEELERQNLKPVEFVYSYKKIWTPYYTNEPEYSSKVAIATETDVTPVSRAELLDAVADKRLLWAYDWSSMGDAYLHFCHCSADTLPDVRNVGGVHFLFDAPHSIPSEMLVGIGEDFDRGDDIMDYCASEYFTRYF